MARENLIEYIKSPIATNVISAILNATDMKPWAAQLVIWMDTQLIKKDVKKMAIKFADKLIEMARDIVKEAEKL